MTPGYTLKSQNTCFRPDTDKVLETSIECEVANWYRNEWFFVGALVPYLENNFGVHPEIKIDDLPLGVWVRDLERAYIALREESWGVVKAIKSTRKFFRNKSLEAIRKYLEFRLEALHSKITSREEPPATEE
jgi:hypothetical protein